jgi:hypothetical protein
MGQAQCKDRQTGKKCICEAQKLEECQSVPVEPWSVWCRKKETEKPKAVMTWHTKRKHISTGKKEKVEPNLLFNVNWEAVKRAMKSSWSRKFFLTKHMVGMCVVGKWMKL